MNIEKRICCACKIEKVITDFSKDKSEKSGYTYKCKDCRNKYYKEYYLANPEKVKIKNLKQSENRKGFYSSEAGILSSRKSHLKRKFNITLEEYNILSVKQKHVCYICNNPETLETLKYLSVDHCHKTGLIRGLLCSKCNRGLGCFRDNIYFLEKAIKYLKK